MLKFDVITIFPEFFKGPLGASLIGKARHKKLLDINVRNLRDYSADRHKTVDDRVYGGGDGMVFKLEPLTKAVADIVKKKKDVRVILTSPRGEKLTAEKARRLAKSRQIVIICGHYEGVDERVTRLVTDEISIGDYVLTGGEAAALVIMEAVARFIPGVVGKASSVARESFMDGLLDFPVFTRPAEFRGEKVPAELLTGNHKKIAGFRLRAAIKETLIRRPEMLAEKTLSSEEKSVLEEIFINEEETSW